MHLDLVSSVVVGAEICRGLLAAPLHENYTQKKVPLAAERGPSVGGGLWGGAVLFVVPQNFLRLEVGERRTLSTLCLVLSRLRRDKAQQGSDKVYKRGAWRTAQTHATARTPAA